MADIPPERVADAMHTTKDELPTGYTEDILAAEILLERQIEPHADGSDADAVTTTGVYVAAAFITGTEGDAHVEDIERESSAFSFDLDGMSDEAKDFWSRAVMFDPTGKLEDASENTVEFQFGAAGGSSNQPRGFQTGHGRNRRR